MIRILFVDDEPLIRMAFRSLLNWKKEGYIIAGEAVNGEEALQFLYRNRNIDILITDIEMPERDGISLIKAALSVYPNLHIIVLSAFDDYDYVREAFKLGAGDYLLKKDLDEEHLLPLLRKISPQLRNEEEAPDEDSLLRALLYHHDGMTKKVLNESSISLLDDILIICDLVLDREINVSDRISPENLINLTLSVITQITQGRKHHYALSLSSREYVLILSYPAPRNNAYVELKVKSLLQNISGSIEQYLGISCFAGISWKEKWTLDDVPLIYSDAVRLVNQRFFNGLPIVSSPLNIEKSLKDTRLFSKKLEKRTNQLMTLLKLSHTSELQKAIDSFASEFRKTVFSSPVEAIYTALECFRRFLQECKTFETERRYREMTRILNRLQETETIDELINVMESELEILQQDLRSSGTGNMKSQVKTAYQFLLDNYRDPNLSLEQAARKAGVNKTYLSHLFTQELDKKFSDVLTEIRIAHACELLKNRPIPIYQISEKTGYSSVEHFSRVFKKISGCSPGKFREKQKIDQ